VTDYFWPTELVASSSEWRLVANTAAFRSPLAGTTRTLGRGGDVWACTLQFANLRADKRGILQGFLAQLRGQANRVWMPDHAYRKRGNFAASAMVPPATGAWTPSYVTHTALDGSARLVALSHTAGQFPSLSDNPAVLSGAMYALRAFITRSSNPTASTGVYLTAGTASGSDFGAGQIGLKTAAAISDGTTSAPRIYLDSSGTSTAAGDFMDVAYATMSRCMRVNGASQTGSVLSIDRVGATANGVLLPGDFVEIDSYLYMVTERMDLITGSPVQLVISPPLRRSPPNGAPIIVHDPLCKMMLADVTVSWSNSPGGRPGTFSSMTVDLVEDIVR
jgi:hypothetical protein